MTPRVLAILGRLNAKAGSGRPVRPANSGIAEREDANQE